MLLQLVIARRRLIKKYNIRAGGKRDEKNQKARVLVGLLLVLCMLASNALIVIADNDFAKSPLEPETTDITYSNDIEDDAYNNAFSELDTAITEISESEDFNEDMAESNEAEDGAIVDEGNGEPVVEEGAEEADEPLVEEDIEVIEGETPLINEDLPPLVDGDILPIINAVANENNKMRGTPGLRDVKITSFKILTEDLKEVEEYHIHSNKKILISWDASHLGATLVEGDYFDVTLPEEFSFPTSSSATNFDLIDPNDGVTVIAKGVVTPNSEGGGNVRVTFTDKVENKENVKGSMYLASAFIERKVKAGEINTFTVTIGAYTMNTSVKIGDLPTVENEYFTKWGRPVEGNPNKVRWTLRINAGKGIFSNIVIKDTLMADNEADLAGINIIPGTFILQKVVMNKYGGVESTLSETNISESVTIAENGKSFTYNLGDVNKDQYRLYYESTYTPGITLKNKIEINHTGGAFDQVFSYHSASSGGEGSGDLLGKIKIIKHDARSEATFLKGAIFTVVRKSDNVEFKLTTDDKGEAISGVLTPGDYTIKEIVAPDGYLLNKTEINVTVKYDEATIIKIPNHKQAHIAVFKAWVGPELESITVNLLANGVKVDSAVLSKSLNDWKYGFKDLRKYDDNGVEIVYTIEEMTVEGYTSVITENEGYFTITNTKDAPETISFPVKKSWVGPPTDEVKIKLFADGHLKEEITLNAANLWYHNFMNMPKFNEDGSKIVYSVEEVPIDGYITEIKDTLNEDTRIVADGFYITNTAVIDIPVEKKWIGPKADSVTVKLLADGVELKLVNLSDGNEWKHTFKDIPKYKADGTEIIYTIEEVSIEGYTSAITTDDTNGVLITNTSNAKVDIPVEKKWIGPKAESVVIKLVVGTDVKGEVTLNEANSWKHTFTDLPKYDSTTGAEIEYKIEEVSLDGYAISITGSIKDGFTVTNTKSDKLSIPVKKEWVGTLKDSVTIKLLADGEEVNSIVLKESNEWKHTFTDLPMYDSTTGDKIVYSIKEVVIDGYTSIITGSIQHGFTVKNISEEKINVPVKKVWIGSELRSVTVNLFANGEKVDSVVLSKSENSWKHEFKDLRKYDNTGKEIVYTVKEDPVAGYSSTISGSVENGFTITNKKDEPGIPVTPGTGGKIDISVVKRWEGKVGSYVTINLYADGRKIDSKVITEAMGWRYTFKDLKEYEFGERVNYTIDEEYVSGYKTYITGSASGGFVVTNKEEGVPPVPPKEEKDKPEAPPVTESKPQPPAAVEEEKPVVTTEIVEKPVTTTSENVIPKTGDEFNIGLYFSIFAIASLALVYVLIRKKRTQN
ncbi:MAG: Cna B-type domain-containing protein [Tissierellia bacterium]|nr:Cna B-type domain-containing protein [Tissierellia bacterium]